MQVCGMETEPLGAGGIECRAMHQSLAPFCGLPWSAPGEIAYARAAQVAPKFLLTWPIRRTVHNPTKKMRRSSEFA
jgi:hypothetical protein